MKRFFLIQCMLLASLLSGCLLSQADHNSDVFPFIMPEGYQLLNTSESECSIVDQSDQTIGGIVLTNLHPRSIREEDIISYYDQILPECEIAGWRGGSFWHRIWYNSIGVTNQESSNQDRYYSIIFSRGKHVYDMWFDLSRIEYSNLKDFKAIVEK